jgi:hypothetical protein
MARESTPPVACLSPPSSLANQLEMARSTTERSAGSKHLVLAILKVRSVSVSLSFWL